MDSKEFQSVYEAIESAVAKRGEYLLMSQVIKTDAPNKLIWVSECGDQPIPIVAFHDKIRYYDTQTVASLSVPAEVKAYGIATADSQNQFSGGNAWVGVVMTMQSSSGVSVISGGSQMRPDVAGWYQCEFGARCGSRHANRILYNGTVAAPFTRGPEVSGAESPTWLAPASGFFHFNGTTDVFVWQTWLADASSQAVTDGWAYCYLVFADTPSVPSLSQTNTVVEKEAKGDLVIPKVGDSVLIALERGSTRLPRCVGILQSTNYILTSLDDA